MARFCTNCGRELQEGESCDCQNRMIREERETDAGAKGAEQRSGQRDNYRQGVYRQGGYERGNYRQEPYRREGFPSDTYGQRPGQQNEYFQGGYRQGNYSQGGYRQEPNPQGNYHQELYWGEVGRQKRRQESHQSRGYRSDTYPQGDYRQGPNSQSGYNQEPYRQEYYQDVNEWKGDGRQNLHQSAFNEKRQNGGKEDLFRHTRNIFAQIPALLSRPDTTIRTISKQNSSILGLEMLSVQPILILLSALFLNQKMKSLSYGMVELPVLKIFLLSLVGVFAVAYLEAAVLMLMAKAFRGQTTIHKMICTVGYKYLINSLATLISSLLFSISSRILLLPAVIILILGMLASYLFFVEGYRNAVEINPDRRLYALLTGELIFYILIVVIVFFLLVSVISSLPLMSVGNYY